MSAIRFAKIYKSVFDIFCLQEMITDRQTDAIEYIMSRRTTAGVEADPKDGNAAIVDMT